jgi:hypothetical protein
MYNIDPALWGPDMWNTLHYITFSYPETPSKTEIENMRAFLTNIGKVLPCEKCRYHYASNLQKYPLTDVVLGSRYKLISWLVDVHNDVNKRTGKPIVTLEETIQRYMYQKKDWKVNPVVINLIIILTLIVIILFFYKS